MNQAHDVVTENLQQRFVALSNPDFRKESGNVEEKEIKGC